MKKMIELNKIKTNNLKIRELKNEQKKIIEAYGRTWGTMKNEQYKELKEKILFLQVQNDVLINNAKIELFRIFSGKIEPLLEKYKNKPIGEKTKEKICEEIKAKYKENGVNVGCYIELYNTDNFNYSDKIHLYTLNEEGFTDYIIKDFDIDYYYSNREKQGNFTGERRDINFDYLDEKKEAKRIIKEHEKTVQKIDELKKQIEILRKNYNETLQGETCNNYYIN